jgi:mannose-1-phosphate guanylyltransferase
MVMNEHFYVVIPAGGSGTRLWPLSRVARPKFLLPIPGPRTMIQETVARLSALCAPRDMLIVTGSHHLPLVAEQLSDTAPPELLAEPMPRGSGPAIGLGVAIIAQRDPDAIVGSFAADHIVQDAGRFQATVRNAIAVARLGYLVTIGAQPSYPETGYGYIRAGSPIDGLDDVTAFQVAQFKEKPDLETATRYVAEANYLWNTSMFVWKAGTLMDEMRRLLPDLAHALEQVARDWDTPRRQATMDAIWPTVSDITIDHGVLEHSNRVAVVPADFGWADIGDWHGYGSLLETTATETTRVSGDVIADDAEGSIVFGNGRLVALLGVQNVVIVDTHDALLVCDRSHAQDVRRIVSELRQRGVTELI